MNPKNTGEDNQANHSRENKIHLKDLLPYAFRLGERTNTYWAIHTTVFLAMIGWMVSQRGKVFEFDLKIFVTAGVSVFYIVIGLSIINAYEHVRLMITDLTNLTEISRLPNINKGYIGYLKKTNYNRSKIRSAFICVVFYLILLGLIWAPLLWKNTGNVRPELISFKRQGEFVVYDVKGTIDDSIKTKIFLPKEYFSNEFLYKLSGDDKSNPG